MRICVRSTLAGLLATLRCDAESSRVSKVGGCNVPSEITIRCIEWIKALHVIAVISWMAGMLYLPRLFVYHCEAEAGSKQSETFKIMERRLLKAIINPAMIVTWLAGLYLAWSRSLVLIALVSREIISGACVVRRARLFFPLRQGFRRRSKYQESEILSNYQ